MIRNMVISALQKGTVTGVGAVDEIRMDDAVVEVRVGRLASGRLVARL